MWMEESPRNQSGGKVCWYYQKKRDADWRERERDQLFQPDDIHINSNNSNQYININTNMYIPKRWSKNEEKDKRLTWLSLGNQRLGMSGVTLNISSHLHLVPSYWPIVKKKASPNQNVRMDDGKRAAWWSERGIRMYHQESRWIDTLCYSCFWLLSYWPFLPSSTVFTACSGRLRSAPSQRFPSSWSFSFFSHRHDLTQSPCHYFLCLRLFLLLLRTSPLLHFPVSSVCFLHYVVPSTAMEQDSSRFLLAFSLVIHGIIFCPVFYIFPSGVY